MVTMVLKQKILINFTFYNTLMDAPIAHKKFTLLGQGSNEVPVGVARPPTPQHSMWVPKPCYRRVDSLKL